MKWPKNIGMKPTTISITSNGRSRGVAEFLLIFLVGLVACLSLFMVLARKPISSAMALVLLMLAMATIYALIEAHFVAALQAIVYAGAVMVLFVFSIML